MLFVFGQGVVIGLCPVSGCVPSAVRSLFIFPVEPLAKIKYNFTEMFIIAPTKIT